MDVAGFSSGLSDLSSSLGMHAPPVGPAAVPAPEKNVPTWGLTAHGTLQLLLAAASWEAWGSGTRTWTPGLESAQGTAEQGRKASGACVPEC